MLNEFVCQNSGQLHRNVVQYLINAIRKDSKNGKPKLVRACRMGSRVNNPTRGVLHA